MRKKLVLLIVFLMPILIIKAQSSIEWHKLSKAMEKSKKEKKIIFIDIYTDWCGWCKRMDQTTFQDTTIIRQLKKHFIAAKFNAEGNDTIKYGGKEYINHNYGQRRATHPFTFAILGSRVGYPSFAFMDHNNQIIGVLNGYQPAENLAPVLNYFSSGSYKTKSYEEYLKTKKQ